MDDDFGGSQFWGGVKKKSVALGELQQKSLENAMTVMICSEKSLGR